MPQSVQQCLYHGRAKRFNCVCYTLILCVPKTIIRFAGLGPVAVHGGHGERRAAVHVPSSPPLPPVALKNQIGSRCILSRPASITKWQHEANEGVKFSHMDR